MTTRKILVRSAFWLGLVEVISKAIMFGVTVSLVRYLGPKQFGSYNLAASYVAMFMILSDLGLSTVATRAIARYKDQTERYLANLLGLKLILSGIIILLISVSFFIVPSSGARSIILAVLAYNIVQNIGAIFSTIFIAWERMELVFLSKLSYYLGILASAALTITFHWSILGLVVSYIVGTVISIAISSLLARKLNVSVKIAFEKEFCLELLRESIPFMGMAVVSVIYLNSDTLLIGHFFGSEQVGLYQAAYKILFAFQSINVINSVIFPRINVLIHEHQTETLNKLIKTIVILSLIVLLPLATAITIFRDQIITTIYGAAYLPAAPAMALLIWSGVINYFRTFAGSILIANKKQTLVFRALTIGLFLNVLINIFIMASYSIVVAAISMVASEITVTMIMIRINIVKKNKST